MNISLVIPTYREWDSIARTLSSIWWAIQNISNEIKINVIVVINNPSSVDSHTLEQNKITSDFLKNLNLKSIPEEFISTNWSDAISKLIPAFTPEKVQEWLDLLDERWKIIEIDMWSNWNSSYISNVWIARHRWFIEAKKYDLNNQWFIVSLDADTMISRWYLEIALETLSKYRNVIYWPRMNLWIKKDEQILLKIQQNDYLMNLLEYLQTDLITLEKWNSQQTDIFPFKYKMSLITNKTHFEWSNIVIPSEVYGWEYIFPPIWWEEDTYLCNSLINWWLPPTFNDWLIVLSQDRISDRTDTWDWTFNKSIMWNLRDIKVRDLEWTNILLKIFNSVMLLNKKRIHISEIEWIFSDNLKFCLYVFSKYSDKDGYFDVKNFENELFTADIWRTILEKYNISLTDWFKELYNMVKWKKWQPYYWIKKRIEDIGKNSKLWISLK